MGTNDTMDVEKTVGMFEDSLPRDTSVEISELDGMEINEKLLETIKAFGLQIFYEEVVAAIDELASHPFSLAYPIHKLTPYEERVLMIYLISGGMNGCGLKSIRHPKLDLVGMPGYKTWEKYRSKLEAGSRG